MVAGGIEQQDSVDKEDASSSTVTAELVLQSCSIDGREGRDVAVIDIPNAFVQTVIEHEKDKFTVRMCVLCNLATEVYLSFVTTDKNT